MILGTKGPPPTVTAYPQRLPLLPPRQPDLFSSPCLPLGAWACLALPNQTPDLFCGGGGGRWSPALPCPVGYCPPLLTFDSSYLLVTYCTPSTEVRASYPRVTKSLPMGRYAIPILQTEIQRCRGRRDSPRVMEFISGTGECTSRPFRLCTTSPTLLASALAASRPRGAVCLDPSRVTGGWLDASGSLSDPGRSENQSSFTLAQSAEGRKVSAGAIIVSQERPTPKG